MDRMFRNIINLLSYFVSKYNKRYSSTDINVEINGTRVAFSNQKPKVISGTTYVPLRGVFAE